MTVKIGESLLIAALLSRVSAHATDNAISIALGEGEQLAIFKVDESRCGLKDDQSPLRAEKPVIQRRTQQ